jgi:hypothetical protein
MIGGTFATVQGGSFRSGFISAGFGALSGGLGCDGYVCRAIAGGVGSRLAGGHFVDGAVTAELGLIFNELADHSSRTTIEAGEGAGFIERIKRFFGIEGGALSEAVTRVGGEVVRTGVAALDTDVAQGVAAIGINKNLNLCDGASLCDYLEDAPRISGYLAQSPPDYRAVGQLFVDRGWQYRSLSELLGERQ